MLKFKIQSLGKLHNLYFNIRQIMYDFIQALCITSLEVEKNVNCLLN